MIVLTFRLRCLTSFHRQERQRESSVHPASQPDILCPVNIHRVRSRPSDGDQPQQRRPPALGALVQVPGDGQAQWYCQVHTIMYIQTIHNLYGKLLANLKHWWKIIFLVTNLLVIQKSQT